CHQYNDLVFTF
nr:immunoglobulin light chain junction region [Macaca mulatta]